MFGLSIPISSFSFLDSSVSSWFHSIWWPSDSEWSRVECVTVHSHADQRHRYTEGDYGVWEGYEGGGCVGEGLRFSDVFESICDCLLLDSMRWVPFGWDEFWRRKGDDSNSGAYEATQSLVEAVFLPYTLHVLTKLLPHSHPSQRFHSLVPSDLVSPFCVFELTNEFSAASLWSTNRQIRNHTNTPSFRSVRVCWICLSHRALVRALSSVVSSAGCSAVWGESRWDATEELTQLTHSQLTIHTDNTTQKPDIHTFASTHLGWSFLPYPFILMSTKKRVGSTSARSAAASAQIVPLSPRNQSQATLAATSAASHVPPSSSPPSLDSLNPYGPGIGGVNPQTLYWSNLCLLGFEPSNQSLRHKCEFYPNMFEKPNLRAMQILLHFLLLKIKQVPLSDQHNTTPEWRDLTSTFQHSFPCIDRTQARDFIACAVGALMGFEKQPANVFPPGTIRKSHFAAPQGERYANTPDTTHTHHNTRPPGLLHHKNKGFHFNSMCHRC